MADLYQTYNGQTRLITIPSFSPNTHSWTSNQRGKQFALLAVSSVDTSAFAVAYTFSLTYKHNLYPLSSQCCVNSPQRSPPLLIRLWRNSNGAFVLCGRDNLIHSCRGLLLQPTAAASQSEMRRHSRIPTTHRNHLYLIQYQWGNGLE